MDDMQLGIDFISLWKQSPGFLRLYVAFFFMLLIAMAVRTIRIRWRFRKDLQRATHDEDFEYMCRMYDFRVRAIKQWAFLAILITTYVCLRCVSDICKAIAKYVPSNACTSGGYFDFLVWIALGLFACSLMYAGSIYLQAALDRIRSNVKKPA